jgi:hypothetical protein
MEVDTVSEVYDFNFYSEIKEATLGWVWAGMRQAGNAYRILAWKTP